MNQTKTGKFIAAMRKEQSLTQKQLAERLGISDKTISKWETGNGMPEVSLMLPLCENLKISVNELLSGERLTDTEYHEKAEENMMNLIREKEESRKKIILSLVVVMMGLSVLTVCMLLAGYTAALGVLQKILLTIFGWIIFLVSVSVAIFLDREAGSYECLHCGTHFTPDMKAYVMGPHTITRRKLTCPECGVSSYCKRRLTR